MRRQFSHREHIKDGAIVAERGLDIVAVNGANRVSCLNTSRREVSSILIIIAGSDGKVKAAGDGVRDSRVQGSGFWATQAHSGNTGNAIVTEFIVGIVHARDDIRIRARARVG